MADDAETLLDRLAGLVVLAGQHRIALSPTGAAVAYAVRAQHGEAEPRGSFYTTGAPTLARGCVLQVTDVATGATTIPLPGATGRSWRPSWSPDGQSLAFYADAGGAVEPHLWRRGDARPRAYAGITPRCRHDAADRPRWSPDGRRLYLPVCQAGMERAFVESAPAGPDPLVLHSGPLAPDPAQGPDAATLWGADIGCVELASGRLSRLTAGLAVAGPHLSPDGRWLAFHTVSRPAADGSGPACALYLLPAAGGEPCPIAVGLPGRHLALARPAWHPGSAALAFVRGPCPAVHSLATGRTETLSALPEPVDDRYLAWLPDGEALVVRGRSGRLYLMGTDGSTPRPLQTPAGFRLQRPLQPEATDGVVTSGGSLLVPAADPADGRTHLLRVPLSGGPAEDLWAEEGAADLQPFSNTWHWFGDATADGGTVVYARETPGHPAELVCRRPATGGASAVLTDLNPGLGTAVRPSVVALCLPGGRASQGLLWRPAVRGTVPLVTILAPDLAPALQPGRFEPEAAAGFAPQYLLARGLAVFLPDIRWPGGATDPGEALAWDALAAIDTVVAQGWADPGRLSIAGYGLGAYAVAALAVRSPRFAAAVTTAGIVNFAAAHGVLEVWHGRPESMPAELCEGLLGAGGGPWADPWRYVRASPLFALDQVTTPVLVISGGDPDPQGEALFSGLFRLGRAARLLRYANERGTAPFHWRALAFRDVAVRVADWLLGP